MKNLNAIAYVLYQELLVNIRSKWIIVFSFVFAFLVMGISYFGLAFIGYEVGFQDFYNTVASLLNLVIYITPIIALVMGVNSTCGETGEMDMLLTQPVSRSTVLIGKASGLFATILLSTFLGFGGAGLIIAVKSGYEGVWKYIIFVVLSVVTAAVFLSLSLLVGILSRRRAKALVVALLLWSFFVIFYDLLVFAISYAVDERYLRTTLYFSLLGNPIDIVRVLTLMILGGTPALGPAGAGLIRQFGGMWTGIILSLGLIMVWIAVPLSISIYFFKRQDIF